MKRPRELFVYVAAGGAALWAWAPPVHAYLDPGTGSVLLQSIIGGIAVAAGVVAHYWHRTRKLFERRRDTPAPDDRAAE